MSKKENAAAHAGPTRLTELQVENYKRIVFLDLKLKPGITEISGRNGAGKSSALDSVAVWLDGLRAAPAEPIRKGCERSRIRGRLGEMYVIRTLRRGKKGDVTSEIQFQPIEGKAYPATQRMLDDLIGEHRLDPLDFIALDRKGKFAEFQAFVPGFDFSKAAREDAGDYARRRDVNRLAEEARAAAAMITVPSDTPAEPIDEQALVEELAQAGQTNADIETARLAREQAAEHLREAHELLSQVDDQIASATREAENIRDREITRLEQQITELQRRIDDVRKECDSAVAKAVAQIRSHAQIMETRVHGLEKQIEAHDALPEKIDAEEILKRIEDARRINVAVQRSAERARYISTAERYEAESAQLTASMKVRQQAKESAIAGAKLPVAGIEFGEEEILLNGVPFDQASTAQKLRVAMGLIVARSPNLRLAWVRDASLLDDESYAEMQRLAAEYDCDILIETVRPIGKDAVVLEDGRLKEESTVEGQQVTLV